MKRFLTILILSFSVHANGQDNEVFKRIDTVVANVDLMASKGTLDTLKGGLLNEGGTASDIFILRQDTVVQKISVVNKSKNYGEKIVFQRGRLVFLQFYQGNGERLTFYFVGEQAYLKEGNKFSKSSERYLFSMIDNYLSLFKD